MVRSFGVERRWILRSISSAKHILQEGWARKKGADEHELQNEHVIVDINPLEEQQQGQVGGVSYWARIRYSECDVMSLAPRLNVWNVNGVPLPTL